MRGRQFDLFSSGPHTGLADAAPAEAPVKPLVPADLDDQALILAIPDARLSAARMLADEAARRRLVAAVPALEQLCRRFAGFGVDCPVVEQVAALDALARIGGRDAADVVARLITRRIVVGPALAAAVSAAARLGADLPKPVALFLLRHSQRSVRADACRCVGAWPEAVPSLVELLDDLDGAVRAAAACALGRMGRIEGRPALAQLLRIAPTAEVIDAVSRVADEECVILLARIARTNAALTTNAAIALDQLDHPRASALRAVIVADQPDRET
jgi:hypothetical protein